MQNTQKQKERETGSNILFTELGAVVNQEIDDNVAKRGLQKRAHRELGFVVGS